MTHESHALVITLENDRNGSVMNDVSLLFFAPDVIVILVFFWGDSRDHFLVDILIDGLARELWFLLDSFCKVKV
jgi:hypothetical protein